MEEIINSVMQSPENTNPNVLRGQLQKMGGSGGGGGVLVVTEDEDTTVLNKTWQEIHDAMLTGVVIVVSHKGISIVTQCFIDRIAGTYSVVGGSNPNWSPIWSTNSATGIPSY